MNTITAVLKNIKSVDNINLLEFEKSGNIIKVLILQMNINIKKGDKALLYIKPTKLFLNSQECEYENRLKVRIEEIQTGEILANVVCGFENHKIEVLMLKENINFAKNAYSYLYFKSSDVSVEVLND